METSYLLDRKVISLCFNPIKESIFILSHEGEKLQLIEEDLTKSVILKEFKLLRLSECNITNLNYKKTSKETYEGYYIYFWELQKKLIVVFPGGYLLIYDYFTMQLITHFQCQGKKAYVIRNIIGSPLKRSLFISAQNMRNIYHINFDNIKKDIVYNKLVIPEKEAVYDLVCHPLEKFIFAACSDGIIRIFNYSQENSITEIKVGLVDIPLDKKGKPQKNQANLIKNSGILSVITMDLNNTGTYLLSGNENGFLYLWDSMQAIKGKRILLTKQRFSFGSIYAIKFIKSRQYENMNRFICITKEGKFHILNVTIQVKETKIYNLTRLCENTIFNPLSFSLSKFNFISSIFISVCHFNNIISVKWPIVRLEKGEKNEENVILSNYSAKFFFIYDNIFPKINFALSSHIKYSEYTDLIPVSNSENLIFERRIFTIDNFFIWCYDIMTGQNKKLLNYLNLFKLKAFIPLKFEVRLIPKNSTTNEEYLFVVLIENEFHQKSCLIINYDISIENQKSSKHVQDVNDFVILNDNLYHKNAQSDIIFIFFLKNDNQNAMIYDIESKSITTKRIEGTILRVYPTPFVSGFTVLYRNALNELRYSKNFLGQDQFDFETSEFALMRLDYSEREVDIIWKKLEQERYICAISMIEKIVLTDENLRILHSIKFNLLENPNIISSLYFIGETLFYNRGNNLFYFNAQENINQRIFSTDQPNSMISGILSDRCILASKLIQHKDINDISITTPMINSLEPILIGYLNSNVIDFNLIKEAVTNLYTNQFSNNLIEKLLKKDLKEVALLLVNDNKSSFQNLKTKIGLMNDLLKFDTILSTLFNNKNLKNDMDLDEIIWRMNYDTSLDKIKSILTNECSILINYGQFDTAMKILEIIGDYQKIINLALLTMSKEEYEKLSTWFQNKNCLSYSDSIISTNVFLVNGEKKIEEKKEKKKYSKVFDLYQGEHFILGANQEKYNITSVKEAPYKVAKKNSNINNINKKLLSFGETAFDQYVEIFNNESAKTELSNICRLVVQKIDQYYGYKNTIYENSSSNKGKPRNTFTDFSVPLSEIKNENENSDGENSLDEDIEEISEAIYLTAYYHCDKGSGVGIEDISDNGNDGTIFYNSMLLNNNEKIANMENDDGQMNIEDQVLWSPVLEEYEPLEYEDKWGRKSPGSHAIKFSKKYNTSAKIKSHKNFSHLGKKFTIEFWTKINSIDNTLFSKDSLCLEVQNNNFCMKYMNKILPYNKLGEYNVSFDSWIHLAVTYKKNKGKIILYFNCEPIMSFIANLSEDVGIKGDLIFGNGNFDGEITEIRIWKDQLPQKFLRENYKSPLPILADNKKKLRMKINKHEKDKKFDVAKNTSTNRFQSFAFGKGNNNSVINNSSASNANRFKSFLNPSVSNNPYNEIKLSNNESSNNNNNNDQNSNQINPINSMANNDNNNSTKNSEKENNNNNEYNPYKSINLSQNPQGSSLRNSFANNVNNDNTMNLDVSAIKNIPEEGDLEQSSYPDINQLDEKKINAMENINDFNFAGSNNFEMNFNNFNNGDNNNNKDDNKNNFGDEFEF